jgi:hypothetical protein
VPADHRKYISARSIPTVSDGAFTVRQELPRMVRLTYQGDRFMKGISRALVVLGTLAIGGCAGHGGSHPPANKAFLDMYDRPAVRSRQAKPARPADEVTTTGSTPAVRPHSPEWLEQERAREKQESERLARSMQICRGC